MTENLDLFSDVWKYIWQFEDNATISANDGYVIVDDDNIKLTINRQMAVFYRSIFVSFGTFIFLINLPVVISSGLLLKKGQEPRSTYLLLGNISMADLVTGACLIIMQLYPYEIRTQLVCLLITSTAIGSTISSVYSVAYIAIDRYLFIVHGLKYNQWVRPIRIRCLITITWVMGLSVGYSLLVWNRDNTNGKVCLVVTVASVEYIIFTTVMIHIPLITSCIFHFIILHTAIKKVMNMNDNNADNLKSSIKLRIFRGGSSVNQQNANENSKCKIAIFKKYRRTYPSTIKAIKVVFFTTASFIITLVPFLITCSLYVLCDPVMSNERCQTFKYVAALPFNLLFLFNSILNPFIYAWWHKGFRKSIKNIYLKKIKRNSLNTMPKKEIECNRSKSIQTICSNISSSTNSSDIINM